MGKGRKKLKQRILQAVYNSKRYNTFGRKEVVEHLLAKKILKIFDEENGTH